MASFGEYVQDTLRGIASLFKSGREAYDGATRFARLRLWFIAAFAADVIAVVVFVAVSGGRPLDLEVWFQPGFPSNMIVFRNEGTEPLTKVRLRLDDKYVLEVDSLPIGLRGFELNRDFRDASNQPPPDAYRPAKVHVTTADDTAEIPVESRSTP